jgi:hypothetical protein
MRLASSLDPENFGWAGSGRTLRARAQVNPLLESFGRADRALMQQKVRRDLRKALPLPAPRMHSRPVH